MSAVSPAVQRVAERLQGLSANAKRVLALRFALDGQGNRTLADTAVALDITPAEVRDIERGALSTLADTEG